MMSTEIPSTVIQALISIESDISNYSAEGITIVKLGGGLINNSYKISSQLKPIFFLQKINTSVFTKPALVQKNYLAIWQYVKSRNIDFHLPSPISFAKSQTLFGDETGDFWRAFEFIDNTKMYETAANPSQAKSTAETFARFTKTFDVFNINKLQEVIPDFHNLSFRYRQFEVAINGELSDRKAKAKTIIKQLKDKVQYKHFYELITNSDQFIKRVMHHDAKIANVLFDKKTGEVFCPVDFDTVMPGYFFSDLGDMIRSMAGNSDETSIDFENIAIRKDFYDAILSGYLKEMRNQLTNAEKDNIHYSGLLMIYMQALRFITDYLNGDTYYQIAYNEQNFDRAKNQLTLLQRLEEFLEVNYNFKLI